MAKADSITVGRILECIGYDKSTGVFTSLIRRGSYRPGEVIGKAEWAGRTVKVDGYTLTFEDLLHVFVVGEIPSRGVSAMVGPRLTQRDAYLRRTYGISEFDYAKMHDAQGGRCGMCRLPSGLFTGTLAVDHCHKTGRVRGLLCSTCNSGIGLLRESPEILEAAKLWISSGGFGNAPRQKVKQLKQ
jgi:hypothetical protein